MPSGPPAPPPAPPSGGPRSATILLVAAVIAVLALLAGGIVALRGNGDETAGEDDRDSSDERSDGASDQPDQSDTDEAAGDEDTSDDNSAADLDPAAELPVDDDVTIGQLDNGLTYYVAHNERPGGRVQLRLAVNAGSALEDDDQRGAAHFLEHMLFNGTEAYPENELISVLESFGSQFGADVNAYTSYDETVYQLGLTDNDPELVATAVDVLAQWADHATIDPAQVEAERGVVIEEWRLRDLGLDGRTIQVYEDQLLGNSPYGDREPIGVIEQLETMDAERLRRFYDQWYRPDLMAVVVVGDVDVEEVEGLIDGAFGTMTNPTDAPARPELGVDPATVEPIVIHPDPEEPSGIAEVMFPGTFDPPATQGELAEATIGEIVLQAMDFRLAADASRGAAPYRRSYRSGNAFVRGFDAPSYVVEADPIDLGESIDHVLVEIERLRQFGLTDQELDRGVGASQTINDQTYDERNTVQDAEYADAYVSHFLSGTPIMDETDRHALVTDILDEVDQAAVDRVIERLFDVDPAITVFGPEAATADLPTPAYLGVLVAMAPGMAEAWGPRPEEEEIDELMDAPEPAEVVGEREIIGFTPENGRELTMANGVRVILYPTNISDDYVTLVSNSPGGFSVIPPEWLAEASYINDLLYESGVGPFDATTLQQIIAERFVYVDVTLSDVGEGFYGNSSTDDLETMLQLVHLYSTQPRIDARAVDVVIDQYEPIVSDPGSDPEFAAYAALFAARYGPDSRHRQVISPTPAELATVTVDEAQALVTDRFTDSTGAVFAIVGNFDMDDAEDLARRYLGTLPTGRTETFADTEADPPVGVVEQTIAAGTDEQGNVVIGLSGDVALSLQADVLDRMLQSILDVRLRDRIREQLGATYSPFTGISSYDQPEPSTETTIQISGEPERLDEILTEALAVVTDLATNGPTEEEMDTAREQLGDELALYSDDELATLLVQYAERPGTRFDEIYSRDILARNATAEEVRAHAAAIWPAGQYIVIRQVPEG